MAKSNDLSIPWPFHGMQCRLNNDTNLIKIVAIVTMFIDHAGKMLFPQYYIMRIIGRLAFPLFAYCLVVGCVYTHDILKYVKRITLLALVSQPIYAVALGHINVTPYVERFAAAPFTTAIEFYVASWNHPGILLSLALGLILLWSIRDKHIVLTFAVGLLVWKLSGSLDYGYRGVLLMLLMYLFCSKPIISFPIVAAYMIWWGLQGTRYTLFGVSFGVQMFAVFALPLIYIPMKTGIKINKWVFYLCYPAHLALIHLIDILVYK